MNETPVSSVEDSSARRRRPQVALSTILLAVAVVAVWLANHVVSERIERLEQQIPWLEDAARELQIHDPAIFAAVEKNPQWFGENISEVYIPMSDTFTLCLASDGIDEERLADPVDIVPLRPGKRRIEVGYDRRPDACVITIWVDGQIVMEQAMAKDWEPRLGSSGGSLIGNNQQFDTDDPLVLFRRRFLIPTVNGNSRTPSGPARGILVWVEKEQTQSKPVISP